MQRPRPGLILVAVSLFLAVAAAVPVRAADRSDAIPVTVGPPGGVGFYVNPDAAGLDPVRVQEILRRSLVRWGNTYLGLTDAAPGADDAINVIGVAALPDGFLGLAQTRTPQTTRPVPASKVCAPTPVETGDTVRRSNRSVSALLRRDVAAAGTVRRRTIERTLRVPRFKRVRAPRLPARLHADRGHDVHDGHATVRRAAQAGAGSPAPGRSAPRSRSAPPMTSSPTPCTSSATSPGSRTRSTGATPQRRCRPASRRRSTGTPSTSGAAPDAWFRPRPRPRPPCSPARTRPSRCPGPAPSSPASASSSTRACRPATTPPASSRWPSARSAAPAARPPG